MYLDCRHKALTNNLETKRITACPGPRDVRTRIGAAGQHPARVVRGLGRNELDGSVYGILDSEDGNRAVHALRERDKY